jgi:hypothetical protein
MIMKNVSDKRLGSSFPAQNKENTKIEFWGSKSCGKFIFKKLVGRVEYV